MINESSNDVGFSIFNRFCICFFNDGRFDLFFDDVVVVVVVFDSDADEVSILSGVDGETCCGCVCLPFCLLSLAPAGDPFFCVPFFVGCFFNVDCSLFAAASNTLTRSVTRFSSGITTPLDGLESRLPLTSVVSVSKRRAADIILAELTSSSPLVFSASVPLFVAVFSSDAKPLSPPLAKGFSSRNDVDDKWLLLSSCLFVCSSIDDETTGVSTETGALGVGEGTGWWWWWPLVSVPFSLPILTFKDFDGEWFPFSCTFFISIDVGLITNVSAWSDMLACVLVKPVTRALIVEYESVCGCLDILLLLLFWFLLFDERRSRFVFTLKWNRFD